MILRPLAGGQTGHCAVAHGGGELAHRLGAAVPGGKDSGQAVSAVLSGQQIARRVGLQQGKKDFVAGLLAHGGKEGIYR